MKSCAKTPQYIIVLCALTVLLVGCQSQAVVSPVAATKPTQPVAPTSTTPPLAANTEIPAVPVKPTEDPNAISAEILLDPALAKDADSQKINALLYEGLVRLDASGKVEPALAESWIISDDQLDYIFTLRPGITFNDGKAITPDVVAANFNRWFDPQDPLHGKGEYPTWQRLFLGFHGEKGADNRAKSTVDGIQKVDQNTVLLHLSRPAPDTLKNLADPAFAILSTDALASGKYGASGSTIISSGPYSIKAWTEKGLQLSPNPKYWGKAAQGDLSFSFK